MVSLQEPEKARHNAMHRACIHVGNLGRTSSPFLVGVMVVALLDLAAAATGGRALAREEAVGAIK